MVGSPHCTIENNVFLNDALGVQLKAASNYNTVRNNIFAKDTIAGAGRGVNIEGSNYTIVSGNLVSKQRYGIYTTSSEGNNISGNTVSQCEDHGIVIQTSKDNTLKNNAVRSNGNLGIYLRYSSNNELENNTVSSGTNGIKLEWSQGDNLSGNRVDLPSEHVTEQCRLFMHWPFNPLQKRLQIPDHLGSDSSDQHRMHHDIYS